MKCVHESEVCHFDVSRPSMSHGVMLQNRLQEKDFTVATPEEFIKRFKGTKVINKVRTAVIFSSSRI